MGLTSGTHERAVTRKAGAAILKGQALKAGANAGEVIPAAAGTDVVIGVAGDAAASGESVPVMLLGGAGGSVGVLATGELAVGDAVGVLGAAVTTGLHIGRALEAAASGELCETDPTTCATL
jgi:hypothetical protein